MFGDLKERFGFGGRRDRNFDEAYEDYADGYGAYDDGYMDAYDSGYMDDAYYGVSADDGDDTLGYDGYDTFGYDGYDDDVDGRDGYDDGHRSRFSGRWRANRQTISQYARREDALSSSYTRGRDDVIVRDPKMVPATAPRLVSIEDVRASARMSGGFSRGVSSVPAAGAPSPAAGVPAASSADVASVSPFRTDTSQSLRSSGLASLFSPTVSSQDAAAFAQGGKDAQDESGYTASSASEEDLSESGTGRGAYGGGNEDDRDQGRGFVAGRADSALDVSPHRDASGAYDPYDAYTARASARNFSPRRSVVVLRPSEYTEVERVARFLKTGDAVVLILRTTPADLAKRILDFTFGVASALDASVECISDKVFAVTRGGSLTDDERKNIESREVW